jgi:cytochrome c-type biogenesis protein CcmH/NrfF
MKPQAANSRQRKRRVAVASPALLTLRRVAVTGCMAVLTTEERERVAESIAQSIMSPFCPGRTVSACPVAGPWRDDIRKMVDEGVEPDEIKRILAARVPEHNLMGVPKNRLGWVLPVGLGVLALGSLVLLLRYLVGPRAGGSDFSTVPLPDTSPEGTARRAAESAKVDPAVASRANGEDYDERLDQELESFEQ